MSKPFIYVAALRRTGSTLLSEALTLPPYSYVFREPRLPLGRFHPKPNDVAYFEEHGVDLGGSFEDVLPGLMKVVRQIGVKEIHHRGWETVHEFFPDMRVVLTGRDPRDIYISMHEKHVSRDRRLGWDGPFTPDRVAEELREDFRRQVAMAERTECLKVRYEDFCTDPAVFEQVKTFVGSDIPGVGAIGELSRQEHNRRVHGGRVSELRVERWKTETDDEIVGGAQRTRDLMSDYCEFWGY